MTGVEKITASDEYFDLGKNVSMPIRTRSEDSQVWFDRGLAWAYGFNHEEAVKCFQQVVAHDPEAAMGYWGIAYALGPNYNKSWWAFDPKELKANVERGKRAIEEGKKAAREPLEKRLIEAIERRFQENDFKASNDAYGEAMRKIYQEFNGEKDLNLISLTADAVMNTAVRKLFESGSGKPILSSPVFEIKDILERGMKEPGAMKHPGVLHFYIHLMEMSETPEAALVASDNLRQLVPDSGHIHHMPSHIYVLVGEYRRSVDTNINSTLVDDKFFHKVGGKNFYSFYRLHDYHSLIYAAMLAGLSKTALESCDRMESTITEDLLRLDSPPMANWMEFFLAVRVHVLIRFGMWEKLKELPIPEDKDLYCVTVAMTYYGKAIAHAATGQVTQAETEKTNFLQAADRVPPTRLDFPNRIVDVLKVARAMLDGEIEYRKGNYTQAFESLRLAVHHDDNLHYTEPWGWMLPTRHSLAALLLEQNHVEEAATLYAEDLGLQPGITRAHQHPNNVWALHGYHECMVRLGRTAEANIIEKQLRVAQAAAEFPIDSSCLCRLETKSCCKN